MFGTGSFPKPKRNYAPSDYPQFALENLDIPKPDPDIEDIRKAKEEEWKKKEKDVKEKQKIEKELQEKTQEIARKQKEYERKNVTADANGNVIPIRGLVYERLTSDFISPKSEIKEKGEVVNPIPIVRLSDKVEPPINQLTHKKENIEKNSSLINVAKKLIINPNPIIHPTGKSNIILNTSLNQTEKEKGPILPAGSSFDLISAEVGVTILEGTKHKTGGKDYRRTFGKYSKYDYLTLLRDTVNSNYSTSNMNLDDNNMSSSLNRLEMGTSNLPLIQNKSNDGNYSNSIKSQYALTGSFKVNNKMGVSLKAALEGLDLIPEYEENITNDNLNNADNPINNSNLFKKTKNNFTDDLQVLEEINKFNLSIVNNTQWGTTGSKMPRNLNAGKVPAKPNLKEIEREVGKNIVKTKLPRARVYSYVKNTPANIMSVTLNNFSKVKKNPIGNETTTSNFNKTVGKKFNKTAGADMVATNNISPNKKS